MHQPIIIQMMCTKTGDTRLNHNNNNRIINITHNSLDYVTVDVNLIKKARLNASNAI